jgi:hypothetical protein
MTMLDHISFRCTATSPIWCGEIVVPSLFWSHWPSNVADQSGTRPKKVADAQGAGGDHFSSFPRILALNLGRFRQPVRPR